MEQAENSYKLRTDTIGVGPHPEPWPTDNKFDLELLSKGDRRNVIDKYRYWTMDAIVKDLDTKRNSFHVAIENWQHDMNIGTIVRTANAFLAKEVHIVGKKRWNKRGAMVTDRYQHVRHHATVEDLCNWASENKIELVGIDNLPGSKKISDDVLPKNCVLIFGQEGPGLSEEMKSAVTECRYIPQFGSTRSINAGVAAGIAMYSWISQHS